MYVNVGASGSGRTADGARGAASGDAGGWMGRRGEERTPAATKLWTSVRAGQAPCPLRNAAPRRSGEEAREHGRAPGVRAGGMQIAKGPARRISMYLVERAKKS